MGRSKVLRPNGTYSVLGICWQQPGHLTHHDVTRDNLDDTYFQVGHQGGYGRVRLAMETFGLQSNERTTRARLNARYRSKGTVDTFYSIRNLDLSTTYFSAHQWRDSGDLYVFIGTGWRAFANKTQYEVDHMVLEVYDTGNGTYHPHFAEWYVDVETNYHPTAPTNIRLIGDPTKASGVTAAWTHNDPEGDAQVYVRFKMFTKEQYTAAGFDPQSSDAYYDSSPVNTSASSIPIPSPIAPGEYRLYAKTSDPWGWGLWGFSTLIVLRSGQQLIL